MTIARDTNVKRKAMLKHNLEIITDAIEDLHCANKLGEECGYRIPDTVFDHLDKIHEEMSKEMVELRTAGV